MNLSKRILVALTILISAGLQSRTNATVLRYADLDTLVKTSDFIFRGKVNGISYALDESGVPWTTYRFTEVEAIAGKTTGKTFSLRCVGGKGADGSATEFEGTPKFLMNDDAIVFFGESSSFCQVRSWENGAFRVMRSASGDEAVIDAAGRPIVSLDAAGLVVGSPPEWLGRAAPEHARIAEAVAHVYGADRERVDTHARPVSAAEVTSRLRSFAAARGKQYMVVPAERAPTGRLPQLRPVPPAARMVQP
jgi:hypothetical protein